MTLTRAAKPEPPIDCDVWQAETPEGRALPGCDRWLAVRVGGVGQWQKQVRWRPWLLEGILIPPGLQCESPRVTRRPGDPGALHSPRREEELSRPQRVGEARVLVPGGRQRTISSRGVGGVAGEAGRGSDYGQSIRAGPKPHSCHPSHLEWDVEGPGTLVTHLSASEARNCPHHLHDEQASNVHGKKPPQLYHGDAGFPSPIFHNVPTMCSSATAFRLPAAVSVPTCETEMESVLAA